MFEIDTAGSLGTLTAPNPVTTDDGDHDRFSHYVRKEDMLNGLVFGQPVMALCGKVWVPSRDGSKFPVCVDCKEIFESFPK